MPRFSFSHTLLASFLLIAAILGSASLGGLRALEEFAARSHEGARRALAYTSAIREVEERTVDMERSARQFLILGDDMLLERFVVARDESLSALNQIFVLGMRDARPLMMRWESASEAVHAALQEASVADLALEPFDELAALNEQLRAEIRAKLDGESEQLLEEVDENRAELAWHVLIGFVASCVLAALMGLWVLRPLTRVEKAIDGLGDNRLNVPIVIDGPVDLRRLGRRLDWLRLRLADLESNRARILRHVSHELKTPLASMREGIALMADGVVGQLEPEQSEVVKILEHNIRVLQERIESLLGYNSAIFDARSLKRRRVALRDLIDEALADHRLAMQTHRIEAVVEGVVPPVLVDPAKMRIVLTNLVANAVSFSPPHSTLRFVLQRSSEWIMLDCIDEGPGVPREEFERIFDPFVQGSRQPAQDREGSGLGLSIVREFVAAHGGRVRLLPSDSGAHFRIELPHEQ